MMRTFTRLLPQGAGLAPALRRRAPTLALDWDARQKSRLHAELAGESVALVLPRGRVMRGGDVLVDEDGGLLCIAAAKQPLLRVTPCPTHGSALDLLRAAYHLGNRHVVLEVTPEHLQLEPDHVLADMLRAMHLMVHEVQAAFEPEAGAYASHGHTADHAHERPRHDHSH
jgi:urease accessory protein